MGSSVQRRRFVHLGIAAIVLAAAGFAVTGLSRLVVADRTAASLGAPLLFVGFAAAVLAFVLAVCVRLGLVGLADGRS